MGVGLAVLVVASRAPVLLQSAASADEGLYALVARELLRGHLPYTTVWETKPPLLFVLLAAAFALFGTTIVALRLATDLAILATALALWAIGTSLRRDGRAVGIAAAVLYATLTLSDGASSALAETFYAPFVALALAVALRRASGGIALGTAAAGALGACLGAAVLVKESALPEAVFAGVVILRGAGARALVSLASGFTGIVVASTLPFALAHAFAAYWDANVAAVARRALVRVTDATPPFDVLRAQALAFFPVTLLGFGVPALLRRRSAPRDENALVALALAWFAVDLVTVALIREYLGNHFIPAMAPASLLGALVLVRLARQAGRPRLVPAVLTVGLLAHAAYQFVLAAPVAYARLARGDAAYGDPTAQLATYLRAHAAPRATLYVADDRAILYVLTGLAPPTRYAYAAHLVDPYQQIVAGVDGPAEIARVLASRPDFVVRDLDDRRHEDARARALLDRALARDYRVAFAIATRTIYVSRARAGAGGL